MKLLGKRGNTTRIQDHFACSRPSGPSQFPTNGLPRADPWKRHPPWHFSSLLSHPPTRFKKKKSATRKKRESAQKKRNKRPQSREKKKEDNMKEKRRKVKGSKEREIRCDMMHYPTGVPASVQPNFAANPQNTECSNLVPTTQRPLPLLPS